MKNIKILGVPFFFGQDKMGVKNAYHFFKSHQLIETLSSISKIEDLSEIDLFIENTSTKHHQIKKFKQCDLGNKKISEFISNLNLKDSFLLNLGGDHGLSLGTIHGILNQRSDTIVVWIDAHGDINTPEHSPSGNFHGMPLAFLLGLVNQSGFEWVKNKLSPKNLILFGPRDLDPFEKEIIRKLEIQFYSSKDIRENGAKKILECALRKIDPFGKKNIHLSFDVDAIDPEFMLSTGTRVSDGLYLKDVYDAVETLGQTGCLKSMDLVEFNPEISDTPQSLACSKIIEKILTKTLQPIFNYSNL